MQTKFFQSALVTAILASSTASFAVPDNHHKDNHGLLWVGKQMGDKHIFFGEPHTIDRINVPHTKSKDIF